MSELNRERSEIDSVYKWDLSSLFENDEAFEKELAAIDQPAAYCASFEGKLDSALAVREFYDAFFALGRRINNLFTYAQLRNSEDTRNPEAQSMYMRIYGKYVAISGMLAFADPEILKLDEDKIRDMMNDDIMKDYAFILENLLNKKAHTLSEKEEGMLAAMGEVLGGPGEISSALMDADMTFGSAEDAGGSQHEVTNAGYILLQSSNDRVLRKNSFEKYYRGYSSHINTFAQTYATAVKAACAEAALRNYKSSRAMAMAEEHIPEEVYDNLVSSVSAHMDLMYRYLALRKRLLRVDELHYYDVYAPLVKDSKKTYTYDQAKDMVLDAVSVLGENYTETVRKGLSEGWIDVYPNKGKSSGAFSSGTYDSNPYIMMNFTGTLDSVSTLAHEMGHSMHTWHSNQNQPPQYAGYTLFVAEVASTVNENLLIRQLLGRCTDPWEKMALLNQYLEGFKGTVFRQTMFAEFERDAHAANEAGKALNAAAFNEMYRKLIDKYFGPGMASDDEVQYEWARIPHFYRPFYVFKYATSYSAAVAISRMILEKGEEAVKPYLEFLSMGSSRYPIDELKHAGVDLTTSEPIETAMKQFEEILSEAEKTADTLWL